MDKNLCESIRVFLKDNMMNRPSFTTKELGMAMGLLDKTETGPLSNHRMETKITDELRRLRDPNDPSDYRRSKETSKHSHLAYKKGFSLRVVSYKSENSNGKRRPAIKWTCVPITRSLETFMTDQKVDIFPITMNVSISELVQRIPNDIFAAEVQRRLTL